MKDYVFPIDEMLLARKEREIQLSQRSHVFWITGISGSGKTTLSVNIEKLLWEKGFFCIVLDGDQLRNGLNKDLGFSIEDRMENVRRTAEVSRILVRSGVIVLCTLISPLQNMRNTAKAIIGDSDFSEIYVMCEMEICIQRDVKGLYKKAIDGKIENMTSVSQIYEEPTSPDFTVNTGMNSIQTSTDLLFNFILTKVSKNEE